MGGATSPALDQNAIMPGSTSRMTHCPPNEMARQYPTEILSEILAEIGSIGFTNKVQAAPLREGHAADPPQAAQGFRPAWELLPPPVRCDRSPGPVSALAGSSSVPVPRLGTVPGASSVPVPRRPQHPQQAGVPPCFSPQSLSSRDAPGPPQRHGRLAPKQQQQQPPSWDWQAPLQRQRTYGCGARPHSCSGSGASIRCPPGFPPQQTRPTLSQEYKPAGEWPHRTPSKHSYPGRTPALAPGLALEFGLGLQASLGSAADSGSPPGEPPIALADHSLEPSSQPLLVRCQLGHVMQAQVVQEIWNGLEFLHSSVKCSRCGQKITKQDARYSCELCDCDYCTACTADMFQLPCAVEHRMRHGNGFVPGCVTAGDIFLCGPDRWGIHHVVLVCGPLEHDPQAAHILCPEPDQDIFSCLTIESSQEIQGSKLPWYSGRSFYARNRRTGAALHVGDMEIGTRAISKVVDSSPVKVLLHPLRPGHGGPRFNAALFKEAMEKCADGSRTWGLNTALSAFTSTRECLDSANYPDVASRKALLLDMRERWARPPICSSVAIMVWQNYFLLECCTGDESRSEDMAVQSILDWIPVFSDQTVPSMLLRALTQRGWVLRGNMNF